jgi:acyl carrier protein
MTAITGRQRIIDVIREEIQKYAGRPFANDEDLIRDVNLNGDDLTAAALSIEEKLGVKIERSRYRTIRNVDEFADVISEAV